MDYSTYMITIEIIFIKKNLEEKKGLIYENIVNLCDTQFLVLFIWERSWEG